MSTVGSPARLIRPSDRDIRLSTLPTFHEHAQTGARVSLSPTGWAALLWPLSSEATVLPPQFQSLQFAAPSSRSTARVAQQRLQGGRGHTAVGRGTMRWQENQRTLPVSMYIAMAPWSKVRSSHDSRQQFSAPTETRRHLGLEARPLLISMRGRNSHPHPHPGVWTDAAGQRVAESCCDWCGCPPHDNVATAGRKVGFPDSFLCSARPLSAAAQQVLDQMSVRRIYHLELLGWMLLWETWPKQLSKPLFAATWACVKKMKQAS